MIAKGLGDAPGGRGAADLILVAYMKPDRHFKRKRADVITQVNVSLADVILGKPIVIENFDGQKIEISTDDGIQDREEKRIKGHGMPLLMEPAKRGDFVVTIHIQLFSSRSNSIPSRSRASKSCCPMTRQFTNE